MFLAIGIAGVAGGGLAGLGVARGDDVDLNGLIDDVRLADVRLVFCGRNPVAVVAWKEPTYQKPAFFVAEGDDNQGFTTWAIRDQPLRVTRLLRHPTWPPPCIWWQV